MPILSQELVSELAGGAEALKCPLSKDSLDQCLDHLEILLRWNRAHNLTKVVEPEEIVTRHLLDSLSIASLIRGKRILDVGSGAGFPGVPLALALPDTQWTLVDSRGKRARFLQEVVDLLGLERVEVVHERIEHYLPEENFDTLVARAVAPLPRLISLTQHLWQEGVRVIAMKGADFLAELKQVPPSFRDRAEVVPLSIPGTMLNRQAIVFQN